MSPLRPLRTSPTDHHLLASERPFHDLPQHRLDDERVMRGVRHDGELVRWPQRAVEPGIALAAAERLPELDHVLGPDAVGVGIDEERAGLNPGDASVVLLDLELRGVADSRPAWVIGMAPVARARSTASGLLSRITCSLT